MEHKDQPINWRRTLALSLASGCYSTAIYVPFLSWSNRFFGESTARAVLAKAGMDNFVLTPIVYLPFFYMFTGVVKGDSAETSLRTLQDKYVDTLLPCWAMWIPGQILNFWLVPQRFRILFIYAIEIAWAVAISLVAHADEKLITRHAGGAAGDGAAPGADAGAGAGAKTSAIVDLEEEVKAAEATTTAA